MPPGLPKHKFHKQDVFFATNRRYDEAVGEEPRWEAFTTEPQAKEDGLQYGKATVSIPKVRSQLLPRGGHAYKSLLGADVLPAGLLPAGALHRLPLTAPWTGPQK